MSRSGIARIAGAAAAFAVAAAPARVHLEAPPPGHTGGFGEPTCLECHFDGPLDDPAGSLTLAELPEAYAPGRTYLLIVALEHPDLAAGGFELTARFAEGDRAGEQAGRLGATPGSGLAVTDSAGISYLHHTPAAVEPEAPGTARWIVEWTAPAGDAPVAFHLAANASNDDNSPFGDWIYAASDTVAGATR